jgi:laminin, alpha 3/5
MNDYGACDQRTGACLKCLNNTAGPSCEKCAHWHYGDPLVLKNCKPCECDRCGSAQCDAKTGECTCHKNVQGYNCASCGENMWGFSDCAGCNDCKCDPIGSTSTQCNVRTGECSCKPGVGGKQCNQCLSDHWDFTDAGCQKCQCQTAGVQVTNTGGFSCNSTSGYCTCIEGVMGKLCDECKPRWVLVKHVGCKKCDTCVHTLLDDVEMLFVKADGIESGNKDSSLTFKAHNKLVKLENELSLIENSMNPSEYDSTPLLNLQREIKRIQDDLKDLKLFTQYDMTDKIANLTSLLDDANSFNKEINELRIKLDILDGIINDLDSADMSDLKNVTDEQLNLYENIVDQIIRKDFSLSLDKYRKSLDEFKAGTKSSIFFFNLNIFFNTLLFVSLSKLTKLFSV